MGRADAVVEPGNWTEVATIADVLVRAAHHTPHRRALVVGDEAVTYRELLERSRQVARGLAALGVERGDHVAILMPNGPEFAAAFFGAAYLGAVVIPLNPRYRSRDLAFALDNADVVVLMTVAPPVAHVDFPALVAEAVPGIATAEPIWIGGDRPIRLRSVVVLSGTAPRGFISATEFDERARTVSDGAIEQSRQRVRLRDRAVILYTSGTTANPKGCILTHEAVTRGPVARARSRFRNRDHDVTWSAGPVFHMGCLQQLIGSIGANGTFVTDEHFDAGRALALIRRERPTICWSLFPAILAPVLDHPDFRPSDLADLKTIVQIGPSAFLARVQSLLPWAELVAVCGMTEMSGIYAVSSEDEDSASRAHTQGRPLPGVSVRIVRSEDGEPASDDEDGELWAQGPCMMDGYYKDPERTAATIDEDGWLHTGDMYRRTGNGNLVFVGRLKEMLKVGGENVSALEIEAFLCEHPGIAEAAVIGVPDQRYDEVPVAFLELRDGVDISSEDVIRYCEGRIASYKRPREVYFVGREDWPMSTTKIDKNQLRMSREERLAAAHSLGIELRGSVASAPQS